MQETALITGASYGIGYALARCFAKDQVNLVITARNADKLASVKAELVAEYGIEVTTFAGDLSASATVEQLVQMVKDKDLTITYLVNNAGLGLTGAFRETAWVKEANMIDLNVRSLTHLTKLMLPDMLNSGKGRILNVASSAAFQPGPLMNVYYATKHYVLAFSEGLAEELKQEPVTVTALCPGPVKTGFQENAETGNIMLFRLPGVKTPDDVARYGYKQMARGKRVAIPGLPLKLNAFFLRFMPRKWVTPLVKQLHKG